VSNAFTNLNLTEMETCYKMFCRESIQGFYLDEDRFGFAPEVTAKIAALGCRVYEVGISYSGRPYEEAKKIGTNDGVSALWCVVKYRKRQLKRDSSIASPARSPSADTRPSPTIPADATTPQAARQTGAAGAVRQPDPKRAGSVYVR
jgi:hypothetical protein